MVAPSLGTVSVPGVDQTFCAGTFRGPVRAAIHKLKYESDTPLAAPLGKLVAGALSPDKLPKALRDEPPTLVPVPLHKERERSRGYNQCALLTEEIARLTGWPLDTGLARIKPTKSQVGLHTEQRKENVAGAFLWQGRNLPERVMLVDDVCTTGVTLAECALALREAGVKRVYAAVVAKTIGEGPRADS